MARAKAATAARKAKKSAKKPAKKAVKRGPKVLGKVDDGLFLPLSEGERADAQRMVLEDRRAGNMARVGRYRLIATEPLVVKPPHPAAGSRLARVVLYDYASDRAVEASVDLEEAEVIDMRHTSSQPLLSAEEQAAATAVALADDRVKEKLSLGDAAIGAMHYWSLRDTDIAYRRRSAAVIFGPPAGTPSLIAVVDLVAEQVSEVVPGDKW
jgi:hypothetical protein